MAVSKDQWSVRKDWWYMFSTCLFICIQDYLHWKCGLWILSDMTFFCWETELIAIESLRFHLDWVCGSSWVIPKAGPSNSCSISCPGGAFRVFLLPESFWHVPWNCCSHLLKLWVTSCNVHSDMFFCWKEFHDFIFLLKINVKQHS